MPKPPHLSKHDIAEIDAEIRVALTEIGKPSDVPLTVSREVSTVTDDIEKVEIVATVTDAAGASASAKTTAVAILRVNLAVRHLLAAARFSREVGRLEKEHQGEQLGFSESIFQHAIACVLTTAASLEAYANELFSDRHKEFSDYSPELIHSLWETYKWKPTLEKFELALLQLRKPRMDRGAPPYQKVADLIELRHALTHFKPEWMKEPDEHATISDRLAHKFEGSPFLSEPELLFPRRWAGHGCTSWAVSSAIAFAKHFESVAGLPAKYVVEDMAALKP